MSLHHPVTYLAKAFQPASCKQETKKHPTAEPKDRNSAPPTSRQGRLFYFWWLSIATYFFFETCVFIFLLQLDPMVSTCNMHGLRSISFDRSAPVWGARTESPPSCRVGFTSAGEPLFVECEANKHAPC